MRRQASGATFALALGLKEKPRAEAGRDLKWLRKPLASPEAAPYSTAHVSGAMARLSQAPVFVFTAPYASAPRIAMAVGTAAAERGYRFNRRQGSGRHRDAEQHQSERLYEVHGYVFPIKARFRAIALYGSLRFVSSSSRVEYSRAGTCSGRCSSFSLCQFRPLVVAVYHPIAAEHRRDHSAV